MAFFSRPPPSQWQATPNCLITNTNGPPGAVYGNQLVHPSQTSEDTVVIRLSKMWGCANPLVLNIPDNAVYVRADWARVAGYSGWTFVPDPAMLARILRALQQLKALKINAPWDAVVPKQTSYSYVFVPFALGDTEITRKSSKGAGIGPNGLLMHMRMSQSQLNVLIPNSQAVPRACGALGQGPPSTFTSYYPPYADFPALQHSCHPYFVIYAAVQHLELRQNLTDAQLQVYSNLRAIVALWDDLKEYPVDVGYGKPGWTPGKRSHHILAQPDGLSAVASGSNIPAKRAAPDNSVDDESLGSYTRYKRE
ncbi:hypothetical protein BV25DRAFT_1915478 [Artomyces pyxidatus]|uniref:Uncharacterized protein n=1 Tax=Artomyces pyxidatus TaxID=48021 RepID=A0ACB8T334_9AGAM|nr:hypothetical protein BV25DRAFT_1915478 [Artomyces pyxidatus]